MKTRALGALLAASLLASCGGGSEPSFESYMTLQEATNSNWYTYCSSGLRPGPAIYCNAHSVSTDGQYVLRTGLDKRGVVNTFRITPSTENKSRIREADDTSVSIDGARTSSVSNDPDHFETSATAVYSATGSDDVFDVTSAVLTSQTVTYRRNGQDHTFQTAGFDQSLTKMNDQLGQPLEPGGLSGGVVKLSDAGKRNAEEALAPQSRPQASAAPAGSSSQCTEAALDAEASRLIKSYGPAPEGAGPAWHHTRRVYASALDLVKEQQRRCPNIDLAYGVQFYTNSLATLDEIGRRLGYI